MSATPTMRNPLAVVAKDALPTEQTFKQRFGGTSESIASSETESTVFIKKLFAVAISNLAYLRGILNEESFSDRYLGNIKLKIIRTGNGSELAAKKMIDYVKGCFDAIERKYLRKVTLWFFEDPDRPDIVKEAYIFKFRYLDEKDSLSMSLTRNEEPVSDARTGMDIKEATVAFLRSLILKVEPLDPFPSRIFMQMRLAYRNEFAPSDYKPPGFVKKCTLLEYPRGFVPDLEVGTVATNHHSVSLAVKAKTANVEVDGEEEEEEEEEAANDKNVGSAAMTYGLDSSPPVEPESLVEEPLAMDVQCVCGGGQDGVMIVCGVCDTWQHGICYGVFPNQRHRIRGHVCLQCVKTLRDNETGRKLSCLNPSMERMKPENMRRRSLFNRTTLALGLKKVSHLSARRLSDRLSIDVEEAEEVLKLMKKSRLLAPCHCDKKTLKFRKTQSQSDESQSQSQDGLSQIAPEEEDDTFWEIDREALKTHLQMAQNEAAKRHQKRMAEASPALDSKPKTKTPKRKAPSKSAEKRLKTES